MNEHLDVYTNLPALFKIAGVSWGIAVPLNLIPLTFIALISMGFVILSLKYVSRASNTLILRVGLVTGGGLILTSTVLTWLTESHIWIVSGALAEGLCCAGGVILGGILMATTHRVFKESC